jgi:hypothetical protein
MKIEFDKYGYDFLEIRKEASGQIAVLISAKDSQNNLNTIVHSVFITEAQLMNLIKSLDLSSQTV